MNLASLFQQEERESIEKWCRAHATSAYLGEHKALCRVLGDLLMYVDTRDVSIAPHMMMNGFWETWVTQAIARYVKPGMRCIDVGANCGYYTLLLASLVGETGHVSAFEPYEPLVKLLRQSIQVNGFSERVQVYPAAASDQQGQAILHVRDDRLGDSTLVPAEAWAFHQVPTIQLDQCATTIDFVKIDVQGYELQVLAGMQELIERSPSIAIALEFSPGEHANPAAALETIRGYGLSIRTIGTDGMIRHIAAEQAVVPDTGDHRMLWLSKA